MNMMRLGLAFYLMAGVSAFALEPPPPYFEDAAQDAKGIVWAYSRAEYDQIYRYDGTTWDARGAPFESQHNAMPAKVVRMTDGAVACVWRYEDHALAVTRHLGNESTLLGTCPGEISAAGLQTTPFADSKNRLWITGNFPKIYRADGKGGVKLMHEIVPAEFRNPANARQGYNDIHTAEDGHGRIWAWSDPKASNWASLSGVLVFTGDKIEMRDPCASLKGAHLLTLAKADATHMWMTVADDGVYKVDIDTLALERTTEPAPKALCCVHELHVVGNDLYAVEDLPQVQDELWRLRNGTWTKVLAHLDIHSNSWMPRSWLPIKEGLLIGTFGSGPWFLPNEGEPAQFTWRSGFTMEDFHAMARFADGSFFGLGRGAEIFHGPLTLPPHESENARVVEIEPDRGWVYASTGHIWMIPRNPPLVLKEWDGTKWIPHDFPVGTKYAGGINEDDQGRLWMYSQGPLIYTPATGQWQNFPKTDDAYLAFKDHPVRFLDDRELLTPQYSADGKRIIYHLGAAYIRYYDGTAWHQYNRDAIMGKKDGDNAVGAPWFDEKGKAHVNLRNNMSFVLNDDGTWAEIPRVEHFPTDIWSGGRRVESRPVPPDGSITRTSPMRLSSIIAAPRGCSFKGCFISVCPAFAWLFSDRMRSTRSAESVTLMRCTSIPPGILSCKRRRHNYNA